MGYDPDAAEIPEEEQPVEAKLIVAPESGFLEQPRYLHPSSILFGILSTAKEFIFAAIFALFLAGTGNMFAMYGAALTVVVAAMNALFRYITLKYQLVDGELRVDQGLIFKNHRTVPCARIQNIDLVQNPLHHLFKVAEVRIETASGNEPEAILRVLSLADVERLRAAVFAEKQSGQPAQQTTASTTAVPGSEFAADAVSHTDVNEGELIYAIPLRRLIAAGLISNRGFVLIPIALGFLHQFDLEDRIDVDQVTQYFPETMSTSQTILTTLVVCLILLVVFRFVSIGWYVLRFFGYRLQIWGNDLRISCGLFTRVSATVPRHRIQFISIQQTLLGRWFGLAMIRLETAGGGGQQSEDASVSVSRRWFVPVIKRSDVAHVLSFLREGVDFEADDLQWQPPAPRTLSRLIRIALLRSLLVGLLGLLIWRPWGWTIALPAAVIFLYFAWRYSKSLKYARSSSGVFYRSGVFVRKASVTFFDKIQNLSVSQGFFDRRWQMATLRIDTAAAGPAKHVIEAKYMSDQFAMLELEQVAASIDQRPAAATSDWKEVLGSQKDG